MVESAMVQMLRAWRESLIPTFQRESLLKLFPSTAIPNGIAADEWAVKMLDTMGPAVTQRNRFTPGADTMSMSHASQYIYRTSKEVVMTDEDFAAFTQMGMIAPGMSEFMHQLAAKCNYNLWRGPKATEDQMIDTTYNYIAYHANGAGSILAPNLLTTASSGKWDAAGIVQEDIASLLGKLETHQGKLATTVVFYPEVCAPIMRRPIVHGTGNLADKSVRQYILEQGVAGCIPIKNELLYTAASANPTVEAFDIYAVDISSMVIGYNLPESVGQLYDDITRRHHIQGEVGWSPLFIPHKYDEDGYYYKQVSRITACDANT
jgi:hypothetical protein